MVIKLPEREYFTFYELIERWKCEENDIRRLIINRQLIPSYVINDVAKVVTFVESGRRIWIPNEVENDVQH